jgi:hypothetical protein
MKRFAIALFAVASFALCERAWAAPSSEARDTSTASGGGAKPASDEGVGKRLGGFATVAIGLPGVDFVNELAGARFELEYTPRFAFGLSLAYANLKGKDGRVSNVLSEASLAYAIPLGDSGLRIPIRFAGGYLPKNGPTLRLSSGFDWALGESMAIELVLLEPMVWVARDRPELSLNLGAAVFGRF